jgi:hypothetical protein
MCEPVATDPGQRDEGRSLVPLAVTIDAVFGSSVPPVQRLRHAIAHPEISWTRWNTMDRARPGVVVRNMAGQERRLLSALDWDAAVTTRDHLRLELASLGLSAWLARHGIAAQFVGH